MVPCAGQRGGSIRTAIRPAYERGRRGPRFAVTAGDGGIGGSAPTLADVARSRQEADLVLHVLADRDDGSATASIADVRSLAIPLQLREIIDGDPQFRLDVLDRMREHDAAKSTGYVDTLRTYLDCFGDVPTASTRCSCTRTRFATACAE